MKTEYSTSSQYKLETETASFQGKEIILENLTPILTPEQELKTRRELEQRLYEIFRKYAAQRQTQEAAE